MYHNSKTNVGAALYVKSVIYLLEIYNWTSFMMYGSMGSKLDS